MAKRGAKPTPTSVLRERGSWRAKLRNGEPQPDIGIPPIPDFLDKPRTRKWFTKIATDLLTSGLVTKIDGISLALMVDAMDRFVTVREELRTGKEYDADKFLLETATEGCKKANPQVQNLHTAWEQLKRYALEFGMSPSARTSIRTSDGKKSDESPITFADKYLKQA